ncbi:group 1 glycosyl transferase (plasmid) [Salinigranum rubrum]|uniref:Group 1 glycosyl transferase n=1 Tax=Salinigranum rubrum TaxID=755307 RepID=A0A2I8VQH5_9EURY|nr:glycosyltransferase [Salinigranum rubrum]AUV84146.1 group 1 glycosyl transferase [Salinigranum rubrum]
MKHMCISDQRLCVQYIVSTLAATGPTRQLLNIVTNLNRDRWSPHIVTLSPEPAESYEYTFEENDIPVVSLSLSRASGLILGPSRLKSITQQIEPDLIHTQGIRSDSMAVHCLAGYPHVTTLRNFPPEDYIPRYGSVLGRLMVWQQFRAARRADRAVACSETIREKYAGRAVTTDAIRNGVDAYAYQPPTPAERRRIRERLGIDTDETVVVSVGGLIKRKDPVTVIEGFLRSGVSSAGKLLLLGDGPLKDQCRSAANESVEVLGHVSDVGQYLKAADVFVSASHSEGLPNAVMEALATGTPIVLSDINPHREILGVNPAAGELFETSNVAALARTLDRVVGTAKERRVPAREIVDIELNAEIMTQRYESLYEEVIPDS